MPDLTLDIWMNEAQQNPAYLDEKTLIIAISERVASLLTDSPDLLWSYLYRLDVREDKIQIVLKSGQDVAVALATLIVDRQKQRVLTKNKYHNPSEANPFEVDGL